jgi:hypothetical protein
MVHRTHAGPVHREKSPAPVSFFLLEPTADAAMTYFYGQLFAASPAT